MALPPLAVVAAGIVILLLLILRLRMHALPALILVSIGVALGAGLAPDAAIKAVTDGMASTLGFIAVVVGLGAMFGALLETSGGVEAIARGLLSAFGEKRAGVALGFVGLIVATPVFFDVAIIILAPILFGLAHKTGRAVLVFALPLLAGLAAGHAFVPPTPGPLAVAQILEADFGGVVMLGVAAGVVGMMLGGVGFGWMAERAGWFKSFEASLQAHAAAQSAPASTMPAAKAMFVIMTPLLLILVGTTSSAVLAPGELRAWLGFIGHPFVALLIGCGLAFVMFVGTTPADKLRNAIAKSLEPAGVIILITGAGGAFKQVLVDTGAGAALAEAASAANLTPVVAGFAFAAIVRVAQGSATVAMITAAGLVAPIAMAAGLSAMQLSAVTIAIAAGATLLSHVNDSGFWLVSRYLNLSEAQTLRTWTITATLVGVGGFAAICALYPLL